MIDQIYSNSPLLQTSLGPKPYVSPGMQNAGDLRYNVNSNNVEVYNGSTWMQLSQVATVSVSPDLQQAVDWVKRKMAEEAEEQRLIKEHPLLKDAHDQYRVTLELVKKHNIGEAL